MPLGAAPQLALQSPSEAHREHAVGPAPELVEPEVTEEPLAPPELPKNDPLPLPLLLSPPPPPSPAKVGVPDPPHAKRALSHTADATDAPRFVIFVSSGGGGHALIAC